MLRWYMQDEYEGKVPFEDARHVLQLTGARLYTYPPEEARVAR